jgi:signal transduction histidine kinase
MDRPDAIKLLEADSPHQRLLAARYFSKNSNPADLPLLRRALVNETVAHVKQRLSVAIEHIELRGPPADNSAGSDETLVDEHVRKEIWAKAVDYVARTLLHEIEPRIGQIRLAGQREVPQFAESRVKTHLDHLERIIQGITQLRQASATPRIEEFDLATLIKNVAVQENDSQEIQISFQGPQPFMIRSDQRLLSLAIGNGVRNAIEAVKGTAHVREPHAIVIAWGSSDVDCWISILDRGPGIAGPTQAAFNIGRTTKHGHSGFGLPITRQAMDSLDGTATLEPAEGGGARLELRWDR